MQSRQKILVLGLSFSLCAVSLAQGQDAHGGHSGHSMPTPSSPAPDEANDSFPVSVEGLPEVKPSAEIRLPDGADFLMEAKPAKQKIGEQWIRRLAYNGSVPGPILRVTQGSSIRLTLQNNSGMNSTFHPHGLRVEYHSDGVPGMGQAPIETGGSYTYNLTFPDAGIYWYHPHVREDYAQEAGLYGVFIVEPMDKSDYNPVHREVPLILDDVLIDANQPFSTEISTHSLMGRFGNVNLVNGMVNPEISVITGEVVRFFVLNTSNTRPFAFAIPDHKLKVVGGDNGLAEKESWAEKIILGPGERSIVEVQFNKAGLFSVRNSKPKNPVSIAQIRVRSAVVKALSYDHNALRVNASATQELSAIRSQLAKPVDKSLQLTVEIDHNAFPMDHSSMHHPGMDMRARAQVSGGIEWDDEMSAMNDASTNENVKWQIVDLASKKSNMGISWAFKRGEYIKVRIFNDPKSMHPMHHPVHFHGQRFVVVATNGKANDNLQWKDTTLVPAGSTVDIVLEMSNPGEWMGHCHISEHMEAGMMFGFEVLD